LADEGKPGFYDKNRKKSHSDKKTEELHQDIQNGGFPKFEKIK
jgi:hypothetical protein